MNLILLQAADYIADDRVRLTDARFLQIAQVHRSAVGDSVRVGVLDGLLGTGEILSLDNNSVELRVALDTAAPAKLPLTVLLALPRPKMARRICRTVAELGVERLVLINSYRVEKSYWQSPLLTPEKIRDYFIEGLQQSRDTVLPELIIEKRFKPFVEDRLPALAAGRRALLAHPHTGAPCPQPLDAPALLAIGPEGGFIPYEVEKLQAAGLQAIDLGARILKVETAVPVLVGKLYSSLNA